MGGDALIALIGTLFGGAGLEIVRRALTKSKEKQDFATALRAELRTDLNDLKKEINSVEKELDTWKDKYYVLLQEKIRLEMALLQAEAKIESLTNSEKN